MCTAVLIGWDPATPPLPRIWTRITVLTRAQLVSKYRRHLFVTPWLCDTVTSKEDTSIGEVRPANSWVSCQIYIYFGSALFRIHDLLRIRPFQDPTFSGYDLFRIWLLPLFLGFIRIDGIHACNTTQTAGYIRFRYHRIYTYTMYNLLFVYDSLYSLHYFWLQSRHICQSRR
jgi:hypothetical protein